MPVKLDACIYKIYKTSVIKPIPITNLLPSVLNFQINRKIRDDLNTPFSDKHIKYVTILIRFFQINQFRLRNLIIKNKKLINIHSKQLRILHCYDWNVTIHWVYHVPFHLVPQRWLSSWIFSLGSSVGESNFSFQTNTTSFVIRRRITWVRPDIFLSANWSVTVRTTPFSCLNTDNPCHRPPAPPTSAPQ